MLGPAPSVAAVIDRLRCYAASRGWGKSRLAKEAGLPDTTLRAFHDPAWNPTADTLRKLEAVVPVGFVAGPSPSPSRADAGPNPLPAGERESARGPGEAA